MILLSRFARNSHSQFSLKVFTASLENDKKRKKGDLNLMDLYMFVEDFASNRFSVNEKKEKNIYKRGAFGGIS